MPTGGTPGSHADDRNLVEGGMPGEPWSPGDQPTHNQIRRTGPDSLMADDLESDAIAQKVNRVLIEQARRHGVDLS